MGGWSVDLSIVLPLRFQRVDFWGLGFISKGEAGERVRLFFFNVFLPEEVDLCRRLWEGISPCKKKSNGWFSIGAFSRIGGLVFYVLFLGSLELSAMGAGREEEMYVKNYTPPIWFSLPISVVVFQVNWAKTVSHSSLSWCSFQPETNEVR